MTQWQKRQVLALALTCPVLFIYHVEAGSASARVFAPGNAPHPYHTHKHVRVRERRPVLKFGECAGTKTEGLTQPLAARQELEIRAPKLS